MLCKKKIISTIFRGFIILGKLYKLSPHFHVFSFFLPTFFSLHRILCESCVAMKVLPTLYRVYSCNFLRHLLLIPVIHLPEVVVRYKNEWVTNNILNHWIIYKKWTDIGGTSAPVSRPPRTLSPYPLYHPPHSVM